ncbi:MAG: ABC transporter permease subunit [Candidatus Hydrogenedentota bacterium]
MMYRIWNAYLVELQKAIRMRVTWVGPSLVVAAVLGTMLQSPVQQDGVSDYRFVFDATTIALDMLGLFLIVIFCSGLIASELSRGTIRTVLVKPLRRNEFLLAKFLWGVSFATILLVLAGGTSWALALVFGEMHGVEYGGEMLYTGAGMAGTYIAAAAFALFPMLALVAYALLISTLNRSHAAATAWAVGLWLLLDIVKNPLGIQPFVFTTYLETWQVFAQRADGFPELGWLPAQPSWIFLVSAVWTIVFVGGAAVVLQRRSLHG